VAGPVARQLTFEQGFTLVHGACGPNPWLYLTNEKTFAQNFAHQEAALAFCGHSHIPLYAHFVEGQPTTVTTSARCNCPRTVR